jgi:hypothetical protein
MQQQQQQLVMMQMMQLGGKPSPTGGTATDPPATPTAPANAPLPSPPAP